MHIKPYYPIDIIQLTKLTTNIDRYQSGSLSQEPVGSFDTAFISRQI